MVETISFHSWLALQCHLEVCTLYTFQCNPEKKSPFTEDRARSTNDIKPCERWGEIMRDNERWGEIDER
jgi:hypothetical protein